KFDVRFTVIVIPDDRTERKKHDGCSQEVRCPVANVHVQGSLRQQNPFLFARFVDTGQNDDERSRRTNDDGIEKYPKTLDKPLFCRVRHVCSCCRVRHRSHTCFVGEQAAAYTLHDGGTDCASCCFFKTECTLHDQCKYSRNFADVHDDHIESDQDVQHG